MSTVAPTGRVGGHAARAARVLRSTGLTTALIVVLVGLVGCVPERIAPENPGDTTAGESGGQPETPSMAPPATGEAAPPGADAATFVDVVDGDTIETSAGTVRILGIDTPERGECGYDEASTAIRRLLSVGDRVALELPPGQNDRDRYGRLIRYVSTPAGVDVGLRQLEAGNALARYDSIDGYPSHPHEAGYHASQVASPGPGGSVITASCRGNAPAPAPSSAGDRWWEQYTSCTKLKKNAVGHAVGPFRRDDPAQRDAYEWYANGTGNDGDGDGDGLACE